MTGTGTVVVIATPDVVVLPIIGAVAVVGPVVVVVPPTAPLTLGVAPGAMFVAPGGTLPACGRGGGRVRRRRGLGWAGLGEGRRGSDEESEGVSAVAHEWLVLMAVGQLGDLRIVGGAWKWPSSSCNEP